MESFISTLPPYVHDFINKQPPTELFHVLRELICFAVLYSNDRQRIATVSKELLEKEEKAEDTDFHAEKDSGNETEDTITEDSITTEEKEIPDRKANMPYTFPEWWGHQEFEAPPRKQPQAKETHHEDTVEDTSPKVAAWVPWEQPPRERNNFRTTSLDSRPIPNLRSYLEEYVPPPNKRPTERKSTVQQFIAAQKATRRTSCKSGAFRKDGQKELNSHLYYACILLLFLWIFYSLQHPSVTPLSLLSP
ncbi:hypothetical protein BDF14DRAFT_1834136 [Spinellus fusiger]|nr:hypothetical protein BDF14DRAFT_1834136 [Spinellus fusiger]